MAVYAIFALAATARAAYQIYDDFHSAPVAYLLSAFSAVVYIVATVCLVRASRLSHHIAVISCAIEFVGVIVVGFLSIFAPEYFRQPSVWSLFGIGYGFVPLVLPVLGLLWLRHTARRVTEPGRLSS
ncbi:membrane protein [Spelaeicoccus albus]